jgi:hypothetical protein
LPVRHGRLRPARRGALGPDYRKSPMDTQKLSRVSLS